MKKILNFAIIFAMAFVLMACPYSSDVALDTPNQKLKKDLMAKWVENGGSENPNFYLISKSKEDKMYTFEQNDYDSNEKKYTQKFHEGYFTTIGNVEFLNLKNKEDGKYYFFKMTRPDEKTFVLFEVTDNITETFKSGAEMKAFFSKNKELSFFYNKSEKTYTKQ